MTKLDHVIEHDAAAGRWTIRAGDLRTVFGSEQAAAEQIALLHDKILRQRNEAKRLAEGIEELEEIVEESEAEWEALLYTLIDAARAIRGESIPEDVLHAEKRIKELEKENERMRVALEYASQMSAESAEIRGYCRHAAEQERATESEL